jgi:hypothetical protein
MVVTTRQLFILVQSLLSQLERFLIDNGRHRDRDPFFRGSRLDALS